MTFAKTYSALPVFGASTIITVEADLTRGLHSFSIVGLPDKAVEESRDRVSAAIKHSGFSSPKQTNHKIVISLAPADMKKEGPLFDLPIALAYLLAAQEITMRPEKRIFLGELSLDGTLRPVRGVLAAVAYAKQQGFEEAYVPSENAKEAALVSGIRVFAVRTLGDLRDHFRTDEYRRPLTEEPQTALTSSPEEEEGGVDFSDVRGQEAAKRGLEIAAAGRHNLVLFGPPGTGKTMLARAATGILPPLSFEEAIEVTAIHSLAGTLGTSLMALPPFRSPHHTASHVSLVGGGAVPRPGEATLAHRGVLFMDEFPEFDRRTIDALREPLEDHVIRISRAKGSVEFPADFILIAAMNPTRGHGTAADSRGYLKEEHYKKKLTGPIVDRIDMWIELAHIPHEKLAGMREGEPSSRIRARVVEARKRQAERFGNTMHANGRMTVREIESHAHISKSAQNILTESARKLDLSPRVYHKMIRLGRTIADLGQSDTIEDMHILEALHYRPRALFD